MVRVLIFLSLIFGGIAMAKDGNYKPKAPAAPIDQDEEFFNSPMGQDITKLFDEFTSGRKTYDQAADEFNQKWGGELSQGGNPTPKQAPSAPFNPVR
jgi:ABC-type glycerol-3-phosphate transport system substrate-binding protein